ncbi:hypothetical protein N779_27220 [Vibrio coralliilyticus OCN008]|nr:hypothetical protein N779_27220 [Vibrio coralliilyticus OCN008]
MTLGQRGQYQCLFAVKMRVQRAFGDSGTCDHLIDADGVNAMAIE